MRNPSVQDIEGFRDALLDLCVKIDLSSDFETIDLCGTGGDGKNTFNISTISSFVVAGAGYKVTKHGNYEFHLVADLVMFCNNWVSSYQMMMVT